MGTHVPIHCVDTLTHCIHTHTGNRCVSMESVNTVSVSTLWALSRHIWTHTLYGHTDTLYWHTHSISPPAPMNHVEYLRAGPAELPFQNWYTANTNHFHLTDSVRWKSKTQLGWVIHPVPHIFVRRIRFWRIKISGTWFYIFVLDNK